MKRKSIFIAIIFVYARCDDKLSWIKKPDPTIPTVYSIEPTKGSIGTEVKVIGGNFSETISNNTITINGTQADVTKATTTELTFIAPDAKTGEVLVTVNNQHANNRPVFTYE